MPYCNGNISIENSTGQYMDLGGLGRVWSRYESSLLDKI
jgi:hypothetical protein